ncbi:MAG: signal recognition particle protein [Bdellovibrionaceae bacterium]|nr:signal recognition particle protein [Pseudobdellovibrionaceae bacterium]MDW8190646.1 signal recognition particle protein [Pseudobdellovibrionaceae bacterium]
MFERLSEKLVASIRRLKGHHKISQENIEEVVKEIRLGLLEADVNYKIVKEFIERVKAKALGQTVLSSLTPGEQFLKIVHDELIEVLGKEASPLVLNKRPSYVLLVGLQGVGKTTSAAKLALFIRKHLKKSVALVPCDIYRPAAIEQLLQLGQTNQIPVYPTRMDQSPSEIANQAKQWAMQHGFEVVIFDTAGRLHIDQEMMQELVALQSVIQPQEILLVVDSQLGQQSVTIATNFRQALPLTGLILTKVDGDARGGAALSIRYITGIPIKFLGVGEKVGALEIFHPDRLVNRLLDLGDIASLVEQASQVIQKKEAVQDAKKILKNQFTLEDFLKQLQMVKKMGGLESLLKFLPGFQQIKAQLSQMQPPDKELKKFEAILLSMTPEERQNPSILNGSRRLRIAKGSGTQVQDVNRLVKQFEDSKKLMGQLLKSGVGRGPFPWH